MRRTLTLCRSGLSVAAAVVLLSACGGGGNDNSASSSSSARSSAAETSASGTSADAAGSAFCTKAADALQSVEPAISGSENDPASLGPALQKAADQVRAIEAPSEIPKDWTALADGIEQLGQIVVKEGTGDPASQSAQQQIGAIVGRLTSSAVSVQTYLSEKCGLDVPTGSAAPTS